MNQHTQNPLKIKSVKQPDNKDSFRYQIQQQILPSWQPLPTINSSIILYLILFIFFIGMGVFMLVQDSKSTKHTFRYDHICQSKTHCDISLNVHQKINGPVYLYYRLTNFKQNQRYYLNSKSQDQLQGKAVDLNTARASCGDKTTNKQMGWSNAVDGTPLDPQGVAFPCGYISYSMFNDTFSIDSIPISESEIVLQTLKSSFKNNDLSKQGIDLQNEHFLVWMRPSSQSNFIKLWGRINQDLQPGVYNIKIVNNYNIKSSEKWLELSNSSIFGNKNNVLGIGYIAVGSVSFIVLLAFIAGKGKEKVENAPVFQ